MYYIIYSIFYLISLLPWRVLYCISDALYIIAYYIVRYRREVVLHNLNIAFPDKTEKEKIIIAKEFYHKLIDSFIETIKLLSVSKKEFDKHCKVNAEALNKHYATGQSVQVLTGHFFNWEMINLGSSANFTYPFLAVYMPLSNHLLGKMIVKMRAKFGSILIPATKFREEFPKYANKPYSMILMADQNPPDPSNAMWMPFFGRMTPFHNGPEKGAARMNTAIFMLNCYSTKRGYYTIDIDLITTNSKALQPGELTKKYIALIENAVRARPSNYLWSHKRFKHEFDKEKHGHLVV